jgi:hypothetical protein
MRPGTRAPRCARPVSISLLCAALVLGGPSARAAGPSDDPLRTASFNDVVHVVLHAGDTIYVGGAFTQATDSSGTHVRRHVAAVDATTGRVLAWSPDTDGTVWSMAVVGSAVYLGGAFSAVDGATRQRLAKVSATTGAVAGDFAHRVGGTVYAMTVHGGGLYVGGSFSRVDGQSRSRLAKFDLANETLVPGWAPRPNRTVLALAGSDGRIFVGGRFDSLNGRSGSGFLAAVDARTGEVATGFDPSIRYSVQDLALTDEAVYAAADGPGGHLRAFDLRGTDVWDLAADGGVRSVAVLDDVLYFGGHFDNVCRSARIGATGGCDAGTLSRRKLAAVSIGGDLLPWAPQANSALGVLTVDTWPTRVAVGGAFTRLKSGQFLQPHFAVFG